MTDTIADLLIRIKNGFMARHEQVVIPHSKMKESIARIMLDHQYLESVEVVEKKPQSELVVKLSYIKGKPTMTNVKRLSKPGRRLYSPAKDIKPVLSGYGLTIISTNKGIMTGKQAKKAKVGGELICQIW